MFASISEHDIKCDYNPLYIHTIEGSSSRVEWKTGSRLLQHKITLKNVALNTLLYVV